MNLDSQRSGHQLSVQGLLGLTTLWVARTQLSLH